MIIKAYVLMMHSLSTDKRMRPSRRELGQLILDRCGICRVTQVKRRPRRSLADAAGKVFRIILAHIL